MKDVFKQYLFNKNILVSEKPNPDESVEAVFLLLNVLNARIVEGADLVSLDTVEFARREIGKNVPEAFYRGFPGSVRALPEYLLFLDQIAHYQQTYGLGRFETQGHSIFENSVERRIFAEQTETVEYTVVTEEAAEALLAEAVQNLLLSSRPINNVQYDLVKSFLSEYGFKVEKINSKDTAVRLLEDLRDLRFTDFLALSDTVKLVEKINLQRYGSQDVRKLNFKNADRRFVARVIDGFFARGNCDVRTCSEKKALWCGLLHHIHYVPKCPEAADFVKLIREGRNVSVYSDFERALGEGDVQGALLTLNKGKGRGAVLRNLDYVLSRCRTFEDVNAALDNISTDNIILLIQLLVRYRSRSRLGDGAARVFQFVRNNTARVHYESDNERARRRSFISKGQADVVCERIEATLKAALKGRAGKVYIDPAMKKVALPIREASSNGGAGVLPKGSRILIGAGKKIRAFTYWEKVNDIDLSVIGLAGNGCATEFSWRTMAHRQDETIVYSGDQTSGYNGGSEFFDVDVAAFRKKYPDVRYLVFCDNVYTGTHFKNCICRAGYMLRDVDDSGEVFEPKTVKSSFTVNCDSTFAYLFGIDLETREFVWLNESRSGESTVAGDTRFDNLMSYFFLTDVINMYSLYEMAADEIVADPQEADLVVSDARTAITEGAQIVRSCDFEKVLALLNS